MIHDVYVIDMTMIMMMTMKKMKTMEMMMMMMMMNAFPYVIELQLHQNINCLGQEYN